MRHLHLRGLPLAVVCGLTFASPRLDARYEIPHSHRWQSLQGSSTMLISGGVGTLYGATAYGGGSSLGTVFAMNLDGTDLVPLHEFTGDPSDGALPNSLVFDGVGTLYGTTSYGGTWNRGTVFRMGVDGKGFAVLRSFKNGDLSSLILDGSGNLYGTTEYEGFIFRMKTDGTAFTVLQTPGGYLVSPLTIDATGNLYGSTLYGGAYSQGSIFKLKTDGSGFAVLHTFVHSDGAAPLGPLVTDDSGNLYGTTIFGGDTNQGTLFTVRTDGSAFQVLHEFHGGPSDGARPNSLLLRASGTLFGTTDAGGEADLGVVFEVKPHGTGTTILHSFAGGDSDGAAPTGLMILSGTGQLVGVTSTGGPWNGGVAFALKSTGAGYALLHAFREGADGWLPNAAVTLDGAGIAYGTTHSGGRWNYGIVYAINTDGTGFTPLHSFDGVNGAWPNAPVTLDSAGHLYGTAEAGGGGIVFTMKTDGTGFKVLHRFAPSDHLGSPDAALVLDGSGYLYGTAVQGGSSVYDDGAVFKLKTDGTEFNILHSFAGAPFDGDGPMAALALDRASTLYGTTRLGGATDLGTAFRINTDGTEFKILHDFAGGSADGADVYASLVLDGSGSLYGTTEGGGPTNGGTIFRLGTDGKAFTLLHTFVLDFSVNPFPPFSPRASVVLDGRGNLYGTTAYGGASNTGSVFRMKTDGRDFALLHTFGFAPTDGVDPFAPLVLDASGYLYGTTYEGGAGGDPCQGYCGQGTVFRLAANPGDADGDGVVTVRDAFYLINALFASGPVPYAGGDANGDGAVDVKDVFYLINFLFASGNAPHN